MKRIGLIICFALVLIFCSCKTSENQYAVITDGLTGESYTVKDSSALNDLKAEAELLTLEESQKQNTKGYLYSIVFYNLEDGYESIYIIDETRVRLDKTEYEADTSRIIETVRSIIT